MVSRAVHTLPHLMVTLPHTPGSAAQMTGEERSVSKLGTCLHACGRVEPDSEARVSASQVGAVNHGRAY